MAKSQKGNISEEYENRVLIVDEVDALVIDEDPNESFVYDNDDISTFITRVAHGMKKGTASAQLQSLVSTKVLCVRQTIEIGPRHLVYDMTQKGEIAMEL